MRTMPLEVQYCAEPEVDVAYVPNSDFGIELVIFKVRPKGGLLGGI